MNKEIAILAKAILETQVCSQLCPDTINDLKKLATTQTIKPIELKKSCKMKFETLKDIPYFVKQIGCKDGVKFEYLIDKKDLRQELGIKWIKALENPNLHFGKIGIKYSHEARDNIVIWIKHVFNISEEDLEESKNGKA